jgi:hypothetical protein
VQRGTLGARDIEVVAKMANPVGVGVMSDEALRELTRR